MIIEKEIKVVEQMIAIYCRKKHKSKRKTLCPACSELFAYVQVRRKYCPFGENKTFCSHCPIHCYKNDKRAEIRAAMRFSGPWMLLYNPVMAISHMHETAKMKRKIRIEMKQVAREKAERTASEAKKTP